jgi:hypothetical protein
VFGLTHTDNNQHVDSLVYPRRFEDAALRRLHERGEGSNLLASATEVVYRKPCFARERVLCSMHSFRVAERLAAVGYMGSEDATPERVHCAMRMVFRAG